MVNYTCMFMAHAVFKDACVHMRTVHTIYTQPHKCTNTHTHTQIYILYFSSNHKQRKQTFTTKHVLT